LFSPPGSYSSSLCVRRVRAYRRGARGKLDPGDVVQQAFLRAYAAWPELKNPDQPVLLAWLRRILARTLAVESSDVAQKKFSRCRVRRRAC
jgi:DNA-directed RNA polymerase specialized sigma24 family protein